MFDYNYVKEYSNTIFNSYRFIEIKGIKASTWYTIYNYGNLEGFNNVYFADDTKYEAIRFGTLLNNRTSRDVQVSEAGKLYLCCYAGTWTETVWNTFIDNFKNAILIQGRNVESNNIPHQEQTFTFPLGNEKLMLGDYLADDGIHHVRGQVRLDSLTWGYESSGNRYKCNNVSSLNIKGAISDGEASTQILSNIFKVYSNNVIGSPTFYNDGIGITTEGLIRAKYVNTTDVGVFEEMLTTTNAILEYELAEETITPYTTAQQTVYNAIKNAISYEEQTNISNNQNALFNVEAYQNTRLVLENFESRLTLVEG